MRRRTRYSSCLLPVGRGGYREYYDPNTTTTTSEDDTTTSNTTEEEIPTVDENNNFVVSSIAPVSIPLTQEEEEASSLAPNLPSPSPSSTGNVSFSSPVPSLTTFTPPTTHSQPPLEKCPDQKYNYVGLCLYPDSNRTIGVQPLQLNSGNEAPYGGFSFLTPLPSNQDCHSRHESIREASSALCTRNTGNLFQDSPASLWPPCRPTVATPCSDFSDDVFGDPNDRHVVCCRHRFPCNNPYGVCDGRCKEYGVYGSRTGNPSWPTKRDAAVSFCSLPLQERDDLVYQKDCPIGTATLTTLGDCTGINGGVDNQQNSPVIPVVPGPIPGEAQASWQVWDGETPYDFRKRNPYVCYIDPMNHPCANVLPTNPLGSVIVKSGQSCCTKDRPVQFADRGTIVSKAQIPTGQEYRFAKWNLLPNQAPLVPDIVDKEVCYVYPGSEGNPCSLPRYVDGFFVPETMYSRCCTASIPQRPVPSPSPPTTTNISTGQVILYIVMGLMIIGLVWIYYHYEFISKKLVSNDVLYLKLKNPRGRMMERPPPQNQRKQQQRE